MNVVYAVLLNLTAEIYILKYFLHHMTAYLLIEWWLILENFFLLLEYIKKNNLSSYGIFHASY